VLIAAALLCVVALARPDHPTIAWLATIGAAAVVTVDLATYARSVRDVVSADAWRWLAIGVSLSALLGAGSAAGYAATRRRLPGRWVAVAGVGGAVAVAAAALWAVANPSDGAVLGVASPLGSLGLVTRTFLVVTVALTTIGLIGDALPAADRATRRVALTRAAGNPEAGLGAWVRAFGDELAPGRTRARRAILDERSRIARDLHADVVPGLRRALAEAERDAPPDRLATTLRDVLAEVEALGTAQHSIQLEIDGLVPALAWLAERTEERSNVSVTLDIAEPAVGAVGAPPPDVAAAAFRVANLALDNVVRHAPGGRASVSVRAEASAVDLAVCDDGPGIAVDARSAATNGRRGLADMAAEASACGATAEVGPGPGGVGTLVTFSWRRVGGG
jgi:signal transduction histidine kinase